MERIERSHLFFVIVILVVAIILLMVPDNNNSMSEGGEPVAEIQDFEISGFSQDLMEIDSESAPPALDIKTVGVEDLGLNDRISVSDVMDAAEGHGFDMVLSDCSPSPVDDDLITKLAEASAPYAQVKLINLIAWLEIRDCSGEADFVATKIEALGGILNEMVSLDFAAQARAIHFSHLIAGLMPARTMVVQDTDLFNAQIDLLALLAHRAMADSADLEVLIEIANLVSGFRFDHAADHEVSIPNHQFMMRKIEIFREVVEGLTR